MDTKGCRDISEILPWSAGKTRSIVWPPPLYDISDSRCRKNTPGDAYCQQKTGCKMGPSVAKPTWVARPGRNTIGMVCSHPRLLTHMWTSRRNKLDRHNHLQTVQFKGLLVTQTHGMWGRTGHLDLYKNKIAMMLRIDPKHMLDLAPRLKHLPPPPPETTSCILDTSPHGLVPDKRKTKHNHYWLHRKHAAIQMERIRTSQTSNPTGQLFEPTLKWPHPTPGALPIKAMAINCPPPSRQQTHAPYYLYQP